MKTNGQASQDIFVLSLFSDYYEKYFLDIGCWEPIFINNTYLLEEHGWNGLSIDLLDMSEQWKVRKTPFVQGDALQIDYEELLNSHHAPIIIDYLNVDIEGNGNRFNALTKVLESKREFKVITIEHDVYRGYELTERKPQRDLLTSLGYTLVCSDIHLTGNPFEDWWINPKYINKDNYEYLICDGKDINDIIDKIIEKTSTNI